MMGNADAKATFKKSGQSRLDPIQMKWFFLTIFTLIQSFKKKKKKKPFLNKVKIFNADFFLIGVRSQNIECNIGKVTFTVFLIFDGFLINDCT